MATIALDIGGTKIASAIFFPDGSMMFNRKRLLKGRTGHEVGKLAADILAKLLTVARRSRIQDRKSTRLNSSHASKSRMPSSA